MTIHFEQPEGTESEQASTVDGAVFLSPEQALHRSGVLSFEVEIAALDELAASSAVGMPLELMKAIQQANLEARAALADMHSRTPY